MRGELTLRRYLGMCGNSRSEFGHGERLIKEGICRVEIEKLRWTVRASHAFAQFRVHKKNKRPAFLRAFVLYGAGTRSRTRDLLITSQLPYRRFVYVAGILMYARHKLEAKRAKDLPGYCT